VVAKAPELQQPYHATDAAGSNVVDRKSSRAGACNRPQLRRFHGENLRCCIAQPKLLARGGDFAKSENGRASGDRPVWDPRSFRLRNFLAIVFAAVLIAAILRHVLHVYGGLPREEIRVDSFIAILIVAAVTVFFQRASRQR
jgi:hypothetical protein